MIGIYLFVSIFAQLSSQNFLFSTNSGPAEVQVVFDKLSGISVGSPVLAEGQLVGTVSQVNLLNVCPDSAHVDVIVKDSVYKQNESSSYRVMLKISPGHRSLVRKGTVALIASPLSSARVQPETVLELLIPREQTPPILRDGASIMGYSSYEDFWSAELTRES